MILIATLLQLIGFYCLYNASERALLRKDTLSVWLHRHTLFSRLSGAALLLVSVVISVIVMGFATGIFTAFISVMMFGSLVVLLIPITIKNN